jgi:DNA-binding CsgD family transcriptional regulator
MTLEERLRKKILEAEPIFDLMPGAVIIHDLYKQTVIHMSAAGRRLLQTTNEELRDMGTAYYSRFFNTEETVDYVPKILGMLERNNDEEFVSFFQQVRTSPVGEFEWWLSSTRIFMRNDAGEPVYTITTSVPVDKEHAFASKANRLLEENNFLKKHSKEFSSLTSREREIIRLMAQDVSSAEIAERMHLSEDTVKTHRRNIKKKVGAANHYDVVRFVQAFDML